MIEQTVIDFLGDNVPTYGEAPAAPPADGIYCIVEKTGGGSAAPGIREATIAVQCFAPTLAAAAQLSESVIGWMAGLPTARGVSRCALNSSYNHTDDRKKQYRYQAVFEVVYY